MCVKAVAKLLIFLVVFPAVSNAQNDSLREWIDQETGRRIIQVSSDSYSMLPYFTANTVSADGKFLTYTSPKGAYLVNLKDLGVQIILPIKLDDLRLVGMGRKNNRLYYTIKRYKDELFSLESIDIYSRQITKHATLPKGYWVESINADETLAVGVSEIPSSANKAQPKYKSKAEKLYNRVNEKIPMTLFTVNLLSGSINDIYKSTEWLSHPQFSPADPTLLMYSLEGPWHLVDRIWTIKSDGTSRTLIHKRTMQMEIAGHEFWSHDGEQIIYDWQYPKGKVFFLASHNVKTNERQAINLTNNQWSIHFNSSANPNLMIGDGGDNAQVARAPDSTYIYLYKIKPEDKSVSNLHLWSVAEIKTEKLVDMRGNDYKLEPNARITPNNEWVFFHSNMFGPPYVFAVEVNKAERSTLLKLSTFDMSKDRKAFYKSILMQN